MVITRTQTNTILQIEAGAIGLKVVLPKSNDVDVYVPESPTIGQAIRKYGISCVCAGTVRSQKADDHASTSAACRTMASPIAGLLYGVGDKIDFTALAWWASALVAVVGAIQAFTINQRTKGRQHEVRLVGRCAFMPDAEQARRVKSSVVHIRVALGDDSGYGTEEEADERAPLFPSRVPRS
ncbi:hypothetical protein LTR49_027198 [Elasticomyces elasticus]|nr:hypothetical protein LTR49_027198 [Elasticomyces elasticus]